MKKVLNLMLIMILMLVVLTGCVNIDYTVKVNKDGSGDITYIYGIKKEALESMELSADDLMNEMKEEVEDSEYTIETYNTDTEVGFKATKHIENVTTDLSLEEAFGEIYITDSEENAMKIEKKSGKTKYSQNARLDLTSMEDMSYFGITMKYSITLPVKVNAEDTNGTVSEDGKTITWKLKTGEVNEISFEATSGNVLIWIICGIVAGGAVIAVVVVVIKKKKTNKPENEEAIREE